MNHTHMPVSTVVPSATTPKTESIATATGASSIIHQRIDSFIKHYSGEANSEKFLQLSATAESARRHGFTACANLSLVGFLEAFRNTPLRVAYEYQYPQCCFLPFAALRSMMRAMNLWCDLPAFYAGAIPPEQMPWLDAFELLPEDTVPPMQLRELINDPSDARDAQWLDIAFNAVNQYSLRDQDGLRRMEQLSGFQHLRRESAARLAGYMSQFQESFFVVAPPEAFTSKLDFRERARRVMGEVQTALTTPPNDPLIIRFVNGGCLVVAAWGDEAAFINEAVAALNPGAKA